MQMNEIAALLAAEAERICSSRGCALLAIDGRSASGKTTLAAALEKVCDCNVFHMDDFFLPQELRSATRLATPGGNVDHERFCAEVLQGILSSKTFSYRPYDCRKGELGDEKQVLPKRISVIEGSYSCHPAMRKAYNYCVFLSVSPEEQGRRILLRNGKEQAERFFRHWIPLEEKYFSALSVREGCDRAFDV